MAVVNRNTMGRPPVKVVTLRRARLFLYALSVFALIPSFTFLVVWKDNGHNDDEQSSTRNLDSRDHFGEKEMQSNNMGPTKAEVNLEWDVDEPKGKKVDNTAGQKDHDAIEHTKEQNEDVDLTESNTEDMPHLEKEHKQPDAKSLAQQAEKPIESEKKVPVNVEDAASVQILPKNPASQRQHDLTPAEALDSTVKKVVSSTEIDTGDPSHQQMVHKRADVIKPDQQTTEKAIEQEKDDTSHLALQQHHVANHPGLFVLLADSRSGSDWILKTIDQHPSLCASGENDEHSDRIGYPSGALMPDGMPWLNDSDPKKGCTLAFVRDHVLELLQNTTESQSTPYKCAKEYDSGNDPISFHLERLCKFVEIVQAQNVAYHDEIMKTVIVKAYMEAFENDKSDLLPCKCPESAVTRGLKVMTDWQERIPGFLDGKSVKVIRLRRRNVFARYMSLLTAMKTGIWQTNSVAEKERKIQAIPEDLAVDIDDMTGQFKYMDQQDAQGDAWAIKHSINPKKDILWLEYDDCSNDPSSCFQSIFGFLGISDSTAYVEEHKELVESSFPGTNGAELLRHITNSGVVKETLGANGLGDYVGLHEYQEIAYFRVVQKQKGVVIRSPLENKGINTTTILLGEYLEDRHKFSRVASHLKQLPAQTPVVISINGADGAVATNHHIRSDVLRYSTIANFRAVLNEISKDGAVVVSATSKCCLAALTHVSPGDFFAPSQSHDSSIRTRRSCISGEPNCLWAGDEKALIWQNFMKDVASKSANPDSTNVYLDGSLMAGKADDVWKLLEVIDVSHTEDERAILTDYMWYKPSSIVLDYQQQLFGKIFVSANKNQAENCFTGTTDSGFEGFSSVSGDTMPLFQYKPRALGCSANGSDSLSVMKMNFPLWDKDGIQFDPILSHIDRVLLQNVSMSYIDRHFGPEILYIVDRTGLWSSRVQRDRYRIKPTDKLLLRAFEILKNSTNSNRWEALKRTVEAVGLPYWAWYGDFKACNYHNLFGNSSIPLYTTCAVTDCNHAFPSPAYMTIIDSQADTGSWYNMFRQFDKDYPWESKQRKVVWRGALSENDPKKVFTSQRWRLCQLASQQTGSNADMFDVGLTYVPDYLTAQIDIDISLVGGLKAGLNPMHAFQKYVAVLDLDGNSWSSRFGTLLCYNSVTIKVEPAYVDYFYYDLIPWKHYIPVKSDLSDLMENVAFATDPGNDLVVKEIIASANQWCAERFVRDQIAHDQLDLWESYVSMLDRADAGWTEKWREKRADIFAQDSNRYDLEFLDPLDYIKV